MHTHSMKSHPVNDPSCQATSCSATRMPQASGLISELVYSESDMTQILLLPLLQQLGAQSRWQLWLTPQQKLSRRWLLQSGLPLDKVMQVQGSATINTVEAMIKALQTGNYSVVLGWLPGEVAAENRRRLHEAALCGQTLGLILRPDLTGIAASRPFCGLKIHSELYH